MLYRLKALEVSLLNIPFAINSSLIELILKRVKGKRARINLYKLFYIKVFKSLLIINIGHLFK